MVDQCNCAGFEVLARRVQAIIDACAQHVRNPKLTIARHFSVLTAWTTELILPSGRQCTGRVRDENEVHTAHSRGATSRPALAGGADDGNADKNQNPTPAVAKEAAAGEEGEK